MQAQARYFIGISPPPDLSRIISNAQKQVVTDDMLMKPINPHITLLDPEMLKEVSPMYLIPKIKMLASSFLPIEIKLTGLSNFGNRVQIIDVSSPGLISLQAKLADLLPDKVRASYMVGREFTPHITLAQAKPKQQLPSDIAIRFEQLLGGLLPAQFTTGNLLKYTWQAPRTYDDSVI